MKHVKLLSRFLRRIIFAPLLRIRAFLFACSEMTKFLARIATNPNDYRFHKLLHASIFAAMYLMSGDDLIGSTSILEDSLETKLYLSYWASNLLGVLETYLSSNVILIKITTSARDIPAPSKRNYARIRWKIYLRYKLWEYLRYTGTKERKDEVIKERSAQVGSRQWTSWISSRCSTRIYGFFFPGDFVRLSGFARFFACQCATVRNVEWSGTEGGRKEERFVAMWSKRRCGRTSPVELTRPATTSRWSCQQ